MTVPKFETSLTSFHFSFQKLPPQTRTPCLGWKLWMKSYFFLEALENCAATG